MISIFLIFISCAPPGPLPEVALPEASSPEPASTEEKNLYSLDIPFTSPSGTTGLNLTQGYPTIFSMFYTSCPQACPLLIQDIQALESELSEADRARLRVVLVSMDPAHDTPEALLATRERHHLDARWVLGTVPEQDVRPLSAALGVKYRPLPGGGFAHTSVLTLVSPEGTIQGRSEGNTGRNELLLALRAYF